MPVNMPHLPSDEVINSIVHISIHIYSDTYAHSKQSLGNKDKINFIRTDALVNSHVYFSDDETVYHHENVILSKSSSLTGPEVVKLTPSYAVSKISYKWRCIHRISEFTMCAGHGCCRLASNTSITVYISYFGVPLVTGLPTSHYNDVIMSTMAS